MTDTVDLNLIVDRLLDVVAPLSPHRYAYLRSNIGQFPAFICTLDFSEDEPVMYDETLGNGWTIYKLQLIFLLGAGDAESAHRRLNDFVSYPAEKSIKGLLEAADPTLGDACRSFIVGNGSRMGTQEFSGGFYLGGRIMIQVTA